MRDFKIKKNYSNLRFKNLGSLLFSFSLPDAVHALSSDLFDSIINEKLNVLSYGVVDSLEEAKNEDLLKPSLIEINEKYYYVRVEIEILNSKSSFLTWVEVDKVTALNLKNSKCPNYKMYGLLANMLRTKDLNVGLFSLIRLEYKSPFRVLVGRLEDEEHSLFKGLESVLSLEKKGLEDFILELKSFNSKIDYKKIEEIEKKLIYKDYKKALERIELLTPFYFNLPRISFLKGVTYFGLKDYKKALFSFNLSGQNSHLLAFKEELKCQSLLSKKLREENKDIFEEIKRGNISSSIDLLKNIKTEDEEIKNAIISYLCRSTKNYKEGLEASNLALAKNPIQSDTLGHKWVFLVELERDVEALEVAKKHIELYPRDSSSLRHLINSYLLLFKEKEAFNVLYRYLINSKNEFNALNYVFRVCEEFKKWELGYNIFKAYFSTIRNKTPDALCQFGEILIELKRSEEGVQFFEKAISIMPEDPKVILGYARSLCHALREEEAKSLLNSALIDENRNDSITDKCFFVTLLAEIYRRTGDAKEGVRVFKKFIHYDLIEISNIVGVIPAVEYAENLIEIKKIDEALNVLSSLRKKYPKNPIVEELYSLIN